VGFHDARGRSLAISITGLCVAARAVLTPDEEHQADDQQDHDDDDDPEHFHPPWYTGIGRPVIHMRLLSLCVVVEAYFITATVYRDRVSSSNRDVSTIVIMYTRVVPKLWNETIEAHRRAVRDAILETTAALVVEHGLTSVTMSQIAEETGIGRATLYKYFPDVAAIVLAWHEHQITSHLDYLAEVRDRAGDAGERLEAVLEAYALFSHERYSHEYPGPELAALLHRGAHVTGAQQQVHDMIKDLLIEAAETDNVRSDVAPDELASYCLHALTAARSLTSKAAVRRLVTVTLAGLRPPR
jgi:AcrR family transcriptional regulator